MGYSIIVPVKAINDYIIESVPITLKINRTDLEIIILPNDMPTGPLPDFLLDPRVSIVASGKVSPAVKRDLGAKISKYENLAFLDDDAYPRIDWLDEADKAFALSGAEAIGGPGITPLDSSLSELASGLFFETYIGGGGMDYRYRSVGRNFFVDDFPTVNLIVKKAAFDSIGGFDNNYWPGEDTKFCLDFVNAGFKIWYCSDVVVYHHRRTLFRPHLKQVGNYGKHRGYFAKKFPQTSARLTYFAPSIFLVGSILLLLLGIFNAAFLKLYILLMAVYFFIAVLDVFSRTRRPILGTLTVATIFVSHLYYGFMFIKGISSQKKFQSVLR